MKHYYGYWPVLAIIKQYLSNIKKRLAQDLKAEQDDHGLPGSNESRNTTVELEGDRDDSSHIADANDVKKAAPRKTRRRHLNGSSKVLGESEESEESEDEFEEFQVDSEVDLESDEDEVDDEADLEDDAAEMEIYEYYSGDLDRNSKQDNEDERHKSDDEGIPPLEESVEYRLFLIYLSLIWIFIANRNPFVNINLKL